MFTTTRRVEFRDTDAAGIVHFSAFFPMMESAEHEMLRSLGLSVMPPESAGASRISWPRVAATCDYLAAARFEDVLTIDVDVVKIGTSSVGYRFRFSRDGAFIATGSITAVCCVLEPGGMQKTPIPTDVRELLKKHQLEK